MPHLSPIVWNLLYLTVWSFFILLIVNMEFMKPSLKS